VTGTRSCFLGTRRHRLTMHARDREFPSSNEDVILEEAAMWSDEMGY
jgi:hypothetical protein